MKRFSGATAVAARRSSSANTLRTVMTIPGYELSLRVLARLTRRRCLVELDEWTLVDIRRILLLSIGRLENSYDFTCDWIEIWICGAKMYIRDAFQKIFTFPITLFRARRLTSGRCRAIRA